MQTDFFFFLVHSCVRMQFPRRKLVPLGQIQKNVFKQPLFDYSAGGFILYLVSMMMKFSVMGVRKGLSWAQNGRGEGPVFE